LYIGKVKTVTLSYSVNISADQKTIFDYLTDWDKQSDWIMFTTVNKLSTSPNQEGTKLSAMTKFGLLKFIDTMVVTEWNPYEKIIVEHTGRVILGKGLFRIQSTALNSCEFIWEEITPVPFGIIGQIGLFIVKPIMKLLFGLSLKKLKRNIETTN
jgi:hypothetical protein